MKTYSIFVEYGGTVADEDGELVSAGMQPVKDVIHHFSRTIPGEDGVTLIVEVDKTKPGLKNLRHRETWEFDKLIKYTVTI